MRNFQVRLEVGVEREKEKFPFSGKGGRRSSAIVFFFFFLDSGPSMVFILSPLLPRSPHLPDFRAAKMYAELQMRILDLAWYPGTGIERDRGRDAFPPAASFLREASRRPPLALSVALATPFFLFSYLHQQAQRLADPAGGAEDGDLAGRGRARSRSGGGRGREAPGGELGELREQGHGSFFFFFFFLEGRRNRGKDERAKKSETRATAFARALPCFDISLSSSFSFFSPLNSSPSVRATPFERGSRHKRARLEQ